jgi:hypothetical protein
MANIFSGIFGAGTKRPTVSPFSEAGVSGAQIVNGYIVDREKNIKLTYLQRSTRYEEIMSNIAVVGAGVRYFTALASSAVWSVEAAEEDKSGEYADFVERMMHELDQSWSTVIKHASMHRYLGYSVGELCAFRSDDGNVFFRSIENRPVRTIDQFDVDDNGNLLGFGQRNPNNGQTLYIPRKKCLYLVDNLMNDSPAGMGVLRHVFESCERLQRLLDLEVMGYAKDLRNIPIGRVPLAEIEKAVNNGEITKEQGQAAIAQMEALVRMKSKLPETSIILDSKPYESRSDTGVSVTSNKQWDLELLSGGASNGLADIGKAIERIQTEIARVLSSEAQMLSGGGSQALSRDKSSNAYLAVNSTLNDIVEGVNKDVVTRLWELNGFDKTLMPKLKVEEISDKDAESVAIVLKDMATAGAPLAPDDEAINDLRSMLGISPLDLEKVAAQMLEDRQMQAQQNQVNV